MSTITRSDLRKYPKPVADALLTGLKENPNLRVRVMDGTHLRIYDGDRESVPFKIAANRPAQPVLNYLLPWLEERKPNPALQEKQQVQEEPPVTDTTPEQEPTLNEYGFYEVDGNLQCGYCDYRKESTDGRGLHLHAKAHTPDHEARIEAAKKGAETRRERQERRRTITVEAISTLIDTLDLSDRFRDCSTEIEDLRRERDDALARLALVEESLATLREALKA